MNFIKLSVTVSIAVALTACAATPAPSSAPTPIQPTAPPPPAMAVTIAAAPAPVATTAPAIDNIDTVLAGAANQARDVYRHPKETLAFFKVTPTSTVIEVWPGGAWYTEILAPLVRNKGAYSAAFPATSVKGLKNFQDKLAANPALYDKVKITPFGVPAALDIKPEGGADVVTDAFMKSFFNALKPGGVLGIVEHRAAPGTTLKQSIDSGYVTEAFVIERALAAGFKLDAKSEINANAKDTKDYPKGVWTLPPSYAEGQTDRAKYLAIGESDRMTLRFVKPL
jgi:predicted methyltransferase